MCDMSKTQSRLESRSGIRSTCDACLESKVRCSREQPACRRCRKHGRCCVYSNKRRLGRPRRNTNKSTNANGQNEPTNVVPGGRKELEVSQPDALTFAKVPFSEVFTSVAPSGSTPPSHMNLASELSIEALLFEDQQIDEPAQPADTNLSSPSWLSGFGRDFPMSFADDTIQSLTFADDFTLQGNEPTSSTTALSNGVGPISAMETLLPTVINDSNATQHHNGLLGSPLPADRLHVQEADYTLTPLSTSSNEMHSRMQSHTEARSSKPRDRGTRAVAGDDNDALFRSGLGAQCHCYADILRRLLQLEEQRLGIQSNKVDQIIKLEKDVRTQALAVTRCKFCSFERPKVTLLVGIVLEYVLDILEGISLNEDTYSTQTSEPREMDSRRDSVVTRLDSAVEARSAAVDRTVLQFGEYEICGQEKLSFLRHIVHARLRELSSLTNECLQQCKVQPSNFKAAATIMLELGQRLHAAMNRLET